MYIFQVAAILMNVATVATHVPLQTTFAQIQKVIAKKKIIQTPKTFLYEHYDYDPRHI